jgi:peptidoglycan/LPS O-acetylase OafA/YrhL
VSAGERDHDDVRPPSWSDEAPEPERPPELRRPRRRPAPSTAILAAASVFAVLLALFVLALDIRGAIQARLPLAVLSLGVGVLLYLFRPRESRWRDVAWVLIAVSLVLMIRALAA